jgi:hypothetical protein
MINCLKYVGRHSDSDLLERLMRRTQVRVPCAKCHDLKTISSLQNTIAIAHAVPIDHITSKLYDVIHHVPGYGIVIIMKKEHK